MNRADKIADHLATATIYAAMAAYLLLISLQFPI
jgi:hypothetical protein